MMLTDVDRPIRLKSALEAQGLVLFRMRGHEELGRLAQWDLELLAERSDLAVATLLGSEVSLSIELPGGGEREFNGIVTAFELARPASTQPNRPAAYRATVRPRLWLLTRGSHCRFFHDMTVPAIVSRVLTDYQIDFDNRCSASYASREHCAQYRETDFEFVSRLLEHEGIYYYFEHHAGKHTLILADSSQVHTATPHYAQIPYRSQIAAPSEYECVYAWSCGGEVQAGIAEVNDYDFEKPVQSAQQGLLTRARRTQPLDPALYVTQEHGAGYTQHDDAERYAQAHVQVHQAANERLSGRTSARGIWPGGLFTLSGHPRADQNAEYLVVSAQYELQSDTYLTAQETASQPFVFDSSFTALRHDSAFRAARVTPRPRVAGPQTAVVVGPSGEEIYTDKYGRIKVQFHWEQFAPPEGDQVLQRCWVRVAQAWAGQQWGAFFLPRVGQEVLVEFIEGDPDRPIVTGSVYNAAQMPPYALPEHSARTTLKSNSTKGGNGFNEMRFDDTKGTEQLFFHAERNLDTYVKHDALYWIGNQRHVIVKGDDLAQCGGNRSDALTGNHNGKIGGKLSLDVAQDTQHKSGMNLALSAGENVDIKGGMNVTIEAGMMLTLKAGGNTIVLGPEGIAISGAGLVTIDGPMVQINCGGGGGGMGAQSASPDAPTDPQQADDGSQ
jgi:type VI secretion system secreted protein VgrG